MKITKRGSDRYVQDMKAESDNRRRKNFSLLAKQFRSASDTSEVRRLGHQLGRLIFGK
jgi:hypothetical protein